MDDRRLDMAGCQGLMITNVRIDTRAADAYRGRVLARVDLEFNGCLLVKEALLLAARGDGEPFVVMPGRPLNMGEIRPVRNGRVATSRDLVHPTTPEAREMIRAAVAEEWRKVVEGKGAVA